MLAKKPIFLGIAPRAQRRGFAIDVIGLSHVMDAIIYPMQLEPLLMVFAVPALKDFAKVAERILFTNTVVPSEQAWVDLKQLEPLQMPVGAAAPQRSSPDTFNIPLITEIISPAFQLVAIQCPPLLIRQPTKVRVDWIIDGETSEVGEFVCAFRKPVAISQEELRALKGRPGALRSICLRLECKVCADCIELSADLDPSDPPAARRPDALMIHDAPDVWRCGCGKTEVPTIFAKQALPTLFREPALVPGKMNFSFTRHYEADGLLTVFQSFQQLINSDPPEEDVQKFLEQCPIFWHFLSPQRILYKPAILTKKRADFAILNSSRVLYLVEIEKPQSRIVTAKGGIGADLQRGADQIRDWKVTVGDHRHALIAELGFEDKDVHDIRFILIAGLAHRVSRDALIKLRRNKVIDGDFLTFDDLSTFVHRLAGSLSQFEIIPPCQSTLESAEAGTDTATSSS
jgi:hypothetical protein